MTPEELNALLEHTNIIWYPHEIFGRTARGGGETGGYPIGIRWELTPALVEKWRLTIQALKMLDSGEYSKGVGTELSLIHI